MLPSIPASEVPDAPLLTLIVGVICCYSAEGCLPVVQDYVNDETPPYVTYWSAVLLRLWVDDRARLQATALEEWM